MDIKTLKMGKLDNNTYIVYTEKGNAVVIDPSMDFSKIEKTINELGVSVKYIFFTHGHYDHTASAYDLVEKTGAKLVIHSRDAEMLYDFNKSLAFMFSNRPKQLHADITVEDGDTITLDELTFEFISTPGHSNGCVVIACEDVMFTGDTVLEGVVGRTDLIGSNDALMVQSVRKLAAIEKNYTLLCGHGAPSTLDFEKKNNPYFIHYT